MTHIRYGAFRKHPGIAAIRLAALLSLLCVMFSVLPAQLAFAADGLRMGGAFFPDGHAVGGMRRRVAGTVLGEVASKSFFHAAGAANIE